MKTNTKIGLAVAVVLLLTVVVLGSNSRFFQGAFRAGQFSQQNQSANNNIKTVDLPLSTSSSRESTSGLTYSGNVGVRTHFAIPRRGSTSYSQVVAGTTNVTFARYIVRNKSDFPISMTGINVLENGNNTDGITNIAAYVGGRNVGSVPPALQLDKSAYIDLVGPGDAVKIAPHSSVNLDIRSNTVYSATSGQFINLIAERIFFDADPVKVEIDAEEERAFQVLPTKLKFAWVPLETTQFQRGARQVEVARFRIEAVPANVNNPGATISVNRLNFVELGNADLSNFALKEFSPSSSYATDADHSDFKITSMGGNMRPVILQNGESKIMSIVADISSSSARDARIQFGYEGGSLTPGIFPSPAGSALWDVTNLTTLGNIGFTDLEGFGRSTDSPILTAAPLEYRGGAMEMLPTR